MTAAAAGHDLDAEGIALAGEIAAETDGNPFFVGEILRNLSESGMIVFDEASGRWSIDRSSTVALPESVREVVERRVAALGDGAQGNVDGGGGDWPELRSGAAGEAGGDRRDRIVGRARAGGRGFAFGRVEREGGAVLVRACADQPHAL